MSRDVDFRVSDAIALQSHNEDSLSSSQALEESYLFQPPTLAALLVIRILLQVSYSSPPRRDDELSGADARTEEPPRISTPHAPITAVLDFHRLFTFA